MFLLFNSLRLRRRAERTLLASRVRIARSRVTLATARDHRWRRNRRTCDGHSVVADRLQRYAVRESEQARGIRGRPATDPERDPYSSQLGVLDRVRQLASKPRAVQTLRGSDNAKLMRLPLDDADRRWGAPYLVIHRADLQRALVEAVLGRADIELSLGTTVVGFVSDGDRISVDLRRGPTVARDEADLLIGADGLRSQVRDRLGFGRARSSRFYSAGRLSRNCRRRWEQSSVDAKRHRSAPWT